MTRFDDVGIERALREKFHVARDGLGRILKHFNKSVTDATTLLLRITDPCEILEKRNTGIDDSQLRVEVAAERCLY